MRHIISATVKILETILRWYRSLKSLSLLFVTEYPRLEHSLAAVERRVFRMEFTSPVKSR